MHWLMNCVSLMHCWLLWIKVSSSFGEFLENFQIRQNSFYKETSQIKNNDQTLEISCSCKVFLCFGNTNYTIWWWIIIENACHGFKEILILIHLTPSRYDHWCDDWLFGLKVEDNLSKQILGYQGKEYLLFHSLHVLDKGLCPEGKLFCTEYHHD